MTRPISSPWTHDQAITALRRDAERLSHGGAGSLLAGWRMAIEQRPDLAAACGLTARDSLLPGLDTPPPSFVPAPGQGR